ncbi:MAG: hypothetical protein M3406_10105 [Chloroflexota bacterium]|nr:hypothetical protein [Chloroflexota bacterium]
MLRDGRLISLTLLSWPFWHDVAEGNTMTFVLVAGVLALRGGRGAALVYIALYLLMPRPVQAPLAIWLLWQDPSIRLPALAILIFNALAVAASGYAAEWVAAMTEYGIGGAAVQVHSIGPPRWLGSAWLLIGVPAGLWLVSASQDSPSRRTGCRSTC